MDRFKDLHKIENPDHSLIPAGQYCYSGSKLCPYWRTHRDKPEQESGYCQVLGEGDWESEQLSLLWDQCKECGINNESYEFKVTVFGCHDNAQAAVQRELNRLLDHSDLNTVVEEI